MNAGRILTVCLIGVSGLTGCTGKVSGRFDMQQRFAAGVEVHEAASLKNP